MKRALVLGGGGNVGIAWELGVLAGLLDAGIDARDADVVVGTSAGSVVGTSIAQGRDPRELLEERRKATPPAHTGPGPRVRRQAEGEQAERERQREAAARPNDGLTLPASRPPSGNEPKAFQEQVTAIFALWTSVTEMTQAHAAQVGALALTARTMPEEQWLAGFAANGWAGWPAKPLLVTAVACETGAFRAFDAASGVPIERAVAASCTVPGLFPPVLIDGVRYMDGGVWSGTSADLAQRIEPDGVLIVAPIGWAGRGIHALAAKQLAQEMAALESAGARVRLIEPDDEAREHMANLMDPGEAMPAAEAGRAHAARIADTVATIWR